MRILEARARELTAGAHLAVFASDPQVAIEGRKIGLELRDTLLVLRPRVATFVFLFRKAITESTVAEQMAKTRTGALNIDGCRIGHKTETHSSSPRKERNTMIKGMVDGTETVTHDYGRWPSNVVFVHGPKCQNVGTKRVKETVAAWECEPECPVRLLDEQSGELSSASGGAPPVRRKPWSGFHGGDGVSGKPEIMYGDTGGASRFYPQFKDDADLYGWVTRLMG
jgi:hypothetical protein